MKPRCANLREEKERDTGGGDGRTGEMKEVWAMREDRIALGMAAVVRSYVGVVTFSKCCDM
jgi:hypothetical protein